MTELQKNYNKAVEAYIEAFCEKQEMYFEFWVADKVGGVASFAMYYFDFSDIKHDIDTKQPKDLILEWQDACIENQDKKYINYESYCMGLRYEDLTD